MKYVKLSGNQNIHHYGLIQDPKNRMDLLIFSQEQKQASFPVVTKKGIITVLNIQNEFAYINDVYPQGLQEYNNSFRKLSNNQTARWRFKEIEYKFNILNKMEDFFLQFQSLQIPGFDITYSPQYFNSVETLFYFYPDSYFSLLRWENDENFNAIKIKKIISAYPILTRDTFIIDYSPRQLLRVLHLFRINNDNWNQHSATFCKRKERHIAIDCKSGHVFGVSCNISETNGHCFCQIELEYWSKIISFKSYESGIPSSNTKEQTESHLRLIKNMNLYLLKNNVQFDNSQLTKNIWLQNIATSSMK